MLLDRDGVLNVEPAAGWVTDTPAWRWEPNALEGLRILTTAGARLSVVTNQSCIGRGVASRDAVDAVHAHARATAAAAGVTLAEFYVCPHAPDEGCRCRKPAPGLVQDAVTASGIPAEDTIFVGDAVRDLAAGRAAGVRVALVRTGKGRAAEADARASKIEVFDDLLAFARYHAASKIP